MKVAPKKATAKKTVAPKKKSAAKKKAVTKKAVARKKARSKKKSTPKKTGVPANFKHPWGVPRYVIWECTREYDDENLYSRPHQAPSGGGKQLDTDQAVALIDNICRLGKPILIFQGGEPLLRPDLFELARYARTKGVRVILGTQGHLFNSNAARECVMAGIKAVQVGLDGSSSRSHDGFRKAPGSFVKAIKGIELMRLAGLRFEVVSHITRENFEEIPKVQGLAQKLGAKGYNVSFVAPQGRFAAFKGSESVGEELEECLQRLFELKFRQKMIIKILNQPRFHEIIYARGEELSDTQDPNRSKDAAEGLGPSHPAAKLHCYVTADGEVFPSPHTMESAGNITQMEFRDIWLKSELFQKIRWETRDK
jgi:MoaA/NifB/PqqE/SkfB family radical SAM enzyme